MKPPLEVYRELRDMAPGTPRRRPIAILELVGVAVIVIALYFLSQHAHPLGGFVRRVARGGGKFGTGLLMLPVVIVGAVVTDWYLRFRERGIEPFAFPMVVKLPRWRIFQRDGDAALYLTDGRGLLVLFARPTADETVEQVLDVIDPDNQLEVDDDEQLDAITFELADPKVSKGKLVRLSAARAYAFVIGDHEHLLDDISGVLRTAQVRRAGERPQKWRPLEAPRIATARLAR